jgi:hypothetical protein
MRQPLLDGRAIRKLEAASDPVPRQYSPRV